MKIVIRAGGHGTRLWPMSRKRNPKQFQNIVGDKTMVRTTYDRVLPIVNNKDDVFISINQEFYEKLKQEIPEIDDKNIIIETDARNTGPAMSLEVNYLLKYCDNKDVIASLPADDFISDNEAFKSLMLETEKFIKDNPDYILTPAIKPYYVDTGYSYLKAGENLQQSGSEAIFKITDWIEKPGYEQCEKLISSGDHFCHTGMYVWQLGFIDNLFNKHQNDIHTKCGKVIELMYDKDDAKSAYDIYKEIEKMTIETAITDKCESIAMSVSDKIGWSDLGKWHIIKRILCPEEKENLIKGDVMVIESNNNLVYSNIKGKVIAINDISDIAVIDTEDALFITSLKKSAEAKKFVEKLKKEGKEQYL